MGDPLIVPDLQRNKRFATFAIGVLAYNLLVVMWGAYVRATGSGAGCGSHWPLCNGEVVPRPERIETVIEFSHRATSGLALLAVVGLLIWAFRAYPSGHRVRAGAVLSMGFMLLEAALGAGLVLFGLVEDDDSAFRAIAMAAHLVNTFLLIGALTVTAWWASGGPPFSVRGEKPLAVPLAGALLAMLALGVTGSIAALGDTLFPSASLAEGIRADFSDTAHFLLRLRVLHPVIAIGGGVYMIAVAGFIRRKRPDRATTRAATALIALVLIQLSAGFLNLALLAPIWLQMVHLLLADLVWIALIILGASALREVRPAPEKSEDLVVGSRS